MRPVYRILFVLFLLVTCYLLLVTFPTPIHAQQACKQACDDRLQQCQSDDCINRPPGKSHDNCINDCVQAKDRCINVCNGRPSGGQCRAIGPVKIVSAEPSTDQSSSQGTNIDFSFSNGADPDSVNGGCDGKGRKFTIIWGDCPSGTTSFDSTCSEPKGQTTITNSGGPDFHVTLSVTNGLHYWYVHSECNCGAAVDSEKAIFTTTCGSKEETAVYNQRGGLTPDIPRTAQEQNVLDRLISTVRSFFAGLFFPPAPCDNTKLYNQSNDLIQITVPDQIVPTSNDTKENLKGFLGKTDGHYCVDFPEEIKGTAIKDCEVYYEPANFPQCIYPITPGTKPAADGSCTPTPLNNPASGSNPSSGNNVCRQTCFSALDQCENVDCANQTGSGGENCRNSCVQTKDSCLVTCG